MVRGKRREQREFHRRYRDQCAAVDFGAGTERTWLVAWGLFPWVLRNTDQQHTTIPARPSPMDWTRDALRQSCRRWRLNAPLYALLRRFSGQEKSTPALLRYAYYSSRRHAKPGLLSTRLLDGFEAQATDRVSLRRGRIVERHRQNGIHASVARLWRRRIRSRRYSPLFLEDRQRRSIKLLCMPRSP